MKTYYVVDDWGGKPVVIGLPGELRPASQTIKLAIRHLALSCRSIVRADQLHETPEKAIDAFHRDKFGELVELRRELAKAEKNFLRLSKEKFKIIAASDK